MRKMKFPPTHIVLHTAAFRGPADVNTISAWHLERGFDAIGYHFVITGSTYDSSCVIQKGRSLDYQGAHALGLNNTIGICVTGHGDYDYWTQDQLRLLWILCANLMSIYKIPINKVIGHRETPLQNLNPIKTCPGKLIDMNEIRKGILSTLPENLEPYMEYK